MDCVNHCMHAYQKQLLTGILLGHTLSIHALSLQSALTPPPTATSYAGKLTITGAGTARFIQTFFYSDTSCTTLLGVGSIIDNTLGFSFSNGQTIKLNGQSIYKLANNLASNLSFNIDNIACMKVYINGSGQSSYGVSCTAFNDEKCIGGTCVSTQTQNVTWEDNPTECNPNPKIYVANNASSQLSVCSLDLSTCTNTASEPSPRGIAVNNGHAYSTNTVLSTNVSVSTATVNPDGSLGTVNVVSSGYTNLSGITLNNNYVYFTDATGTSGQGLNKCSITAAGGALSSCGTAGATNYGFPVFISFNNAYAYIANSSNGSPSNTITKCSVNPSTGSLSSCVDSGGTGFTGPRGIAFNNGLAYIANWNKGNGTTISVCTVDSSSGALSGCAINNATCGSGSSACFTAPYGIALYNNQLYVSNSGLGASASVAVCSLPLYTGNTSVNTCTNYNPSSALSRPYEINIY